MEYFIANALGKMEVDPENFNDDTLMGVAFWGSTLLTAD